MSAATPKTTAGKAAALLILKLLALLLCVEAAARFVARTPRVMQQIGEGAGIHRSLAAARQRNPAAQTVILGDSVCSQFYPARPASGPLHSISANYGASMIGQRLLLEKWLRANPGNRASNVVMAMNPDSLRNDLRNGFAYPNLIKPFLNAENRPHIDPETLRILSDYPGSWAARLGVVQVSSWCPEHYPKPILPRPLFPEITAIELRKIRSLCQTRGMSFRVLGGVMRESLRANPYTELKAEIAQAGLDDAFEDYFSSMVFVPDSEFADPLHVKSVKVLPSDPLKLAQK